jgi:hypothetical protein
MLTGAPRGVNAHRAAGLPRYDRCGHFWTKHE